MTEDYRGNGGLHRRAILKAGAVGAAAATGLIAGGSFISVGAKAQGLTKINLQLSWLRSGNQIGEICARRMGYYEQEGIEWNLLPGGPNIDGPALVAGGRSEIGQLSS